ncbi:ATP-binding protein [Caballeronia zhejiangensis]|uniref:ATP-binding protein n=1 Tax=Caballeronia zhejiangensis TaxID=871203 RepID=UPI00158B57E4|nr:ATP-binding protein [Caballeronia zhejiangensis]MCG7404134.1 ATP-binding protein [Caballeronia zhejiangensis]MCI1046784.1 two-component sensor histidine kinase [Caballeronia zhejiangensis]
MTTIRRWLLGWLICSLGIACLIAGVGIFDAARLEAGELFDYELRTVALSLPHNITADDVAEGRNPELHGIADDRLVIDIWDRTGRLIYHSPREPALPRFGDGFESAEREGYRWRAFGVAQPDRFVQVAQPYFIRDDLAMALALRTIWPLALLIPVIVVIVLLVVARGLSPVRWLSQSLVARSPESLEPVVFHKPMPDELRPLVDALNGLLARLSEASQAQRTFVADAAHELRTPLTALKLQIQGAIGDGSLQVDAATLAKIDGRLNRLIHLAQQLLSMAREDAAREAAIAPMSLRTLCELRVSDFSLLAEARSIDLGLELEHALDDHDPFTIMGDTHALAVLVNNLLDNAIRHSPHGGRVDVTLRRQADGIALTVLDSGPGIPPDEIDRVCDRFYRCVGTSGHGSGLGLAIALRVAQRHHATLDVRNRDDASGLIVAVRGLCPVASAARAKDVVSGMHA